jgi:8-oxo-dGTP pyrophosphatase MutT (NUDIX family)
VGRPKCLVESKFIKIQQHAVQFTPKDDIIPDWIWIDYHERINVLVQAPGKTDEFLIFEQTKYALGGKQSLAIVGGIIEPGEHPEEAARREVQEEMQQVCQEFHFLGRYRTDVNRGGGWTNTYLATHCEKSTEELEHRDDEVGGADTERQDLRRITLKELLPAVLEGKFMEIQWSATVALALLHPELSDDEYSND